MLANTEHQFVLDAEAPGQAFLENARTEDIGSAFKAG